jgi:hypothetical protein
VSAEDAGLPTVDECEEQIADAQYVLDHPDEYDPEVLVQARRSRGLWSRSRDYAAEIYRLEARLARLERIEEAARIVSDQIWTPTDPPRSNVYYQASVALRIALAATEEGAYTAEEIAEARGYVVAREFATTEEGAEE